MEWENKKGGIDVDSRTNTPRNNFKGYPGMVLGRILIEPGTVLKPLPEIIRNRVRMPQGQRERTRHRVVGGVEFF